MCSINGCVDFQHPERVDIAAVEAARQRMRRRGPDGYGGYDGQGVSLRHNRLAVMDPAGGKQPMSAIFRGKRYTIVYNGEIYNCAELRRELRAAGASFSTACDTEVVLWSYILYGESCPRRLNGIFAFCVYDEAENTLFVARDRLGVKPFFYTVMGSTFYFASEIKGLLAHGEIPPEVDMEGLWQLLYLAPVTLPGKTVFRHIRELLPGHMGKLTREGLVTAPYWHLEAREIGDDAKTAAARVRELFFDAVGRQMHSDVPLAVLLSGGLDSSTITAVAAAWRKKRGEGLCTYSFEYEGNAESFKPTLFQPQGDDAFAAGLAAELGTVHTVLTAPTAAVAECLLDATEARDLPGQADIDSSLLYFCREIKKRHTVLLSGECADEIFGGYPWFYRREMLENDLFPWLHAPRARISLFDDAVVRADAGYEFMRQCLRDSRRDCPHITGEDDATRTAREATWLSCRYFMANLLERKDRMSMYAGVEVRVPFADHRILEYVFNLPWHIKYQNGVEKALLRHAMEGYLPERILWRKKSPYPKTHNPKYEETVRGMLQNRLKKGGFLADTLDRRKLQEFLEGENKTWQGQLMSRPQMIAWLCQLDHWFAHYGVRLV